MQRLGQDKSYLATIGERRYHVMERHYALTPEKSGTLNLPALVFRGNALDAADPTGFFSRPRTISARSDAVAAQRQAQARRAGPLPSRGCRRESMLLKDDSELPGEIHVGDPVTRTIRLQAQGLGFEQLPELEVTAPDGAEIYPDKADTRTRDDGTWLYGERVRKFAFVPTKPGSLTVPGVSVHWWDTVHDRIETAELPARTLNVLPAVGAKARHRRAGRADAAPSPESSAPAATTSGAPAGIPSSPRIWQTLAAIGFVLWLITLALWWRSRRATPSVHIGPLPPPPAGCVGTARRIPACMRARRARGRRARARRAGRAASGPTCAISASSPCGSRRSADAMRSRSCSARATPALRRKGSAHSSIGRSRRALPGASPLRPQDENRRYPRYIPSNSCHRRSGENRTHVDRGSFLSDRRACTKPTRDGPRQSPGR